MRTRIVCVLILALMCFTLPALATSSWWTNASGDSLWSNPANWSAGAVPTINDAAYFDPNFYHGSTVVDLGGLAQSVQFIDLNGQAANPIFHFQNGTLSTSGIFGGAGPQLFSINISAQSGSVSLQSSANVQYSGVIGGNGVGSNNFAVFADGVFTAANTYTGFTGIDDPGMTVSGPNGSIRASSQIILSSGMLELDNRNGVNTDRVGDNAPINCQFGSITFDGNSSVASSETVGAVTLGGAKVNFNVYSNGAPAAMSLNSLTRTGSTVLELSLASSPGATPGQLLIQSAASLPMVGGGGAAGSTIQSILPYAIGAGSSFVTYDPGPDGKLGTADDVGLRPLNVSTEYVPTVSPGTSSISNVRIASSQTLSQNATINALAISNATLTIANSQQLQLTSSALSLSGASSQLTAITGGSINFGGREAVIYADGLSSGTQPEYVVDSQLQNVSNITKFGAGTLVLTQPNSFAGTLTIQEGMIGSRVTGALGTANIVLAPVLGPVRVGITFEGTDQTFDNNISQSNLGNMVALLSVASGIKVAYSGAISAELEKTGSGTLWLTPSCSIPNKYSVYFVDAGTLRVDTVAPQVQFNVGTFGNSATLGGSGTLYSAAIELGGILWPGASGAAGSDILTVNNLALEDGKFHVALNGTTPGVQYDQVDVTGNTEFGSPGSVSATQLELSIGYEARPGDRFTIINDAAGVPISGNFAGLPEGSVFSADGDQFEITYQGGDGNDVVLTVLSTPEPSAAAFAMTCLSGLLLRRRARGRDVRG